ncbi:MAG: IS4 family transposase [Microcoleus sp.]
MGGFLGRKDDGFPGVKTLWRGLRRLDDIVMGCLLFNQLKTT